MSSPGNTESESQEYNAIDESSGASRKNIVKSKEYINWIAYSKMLSDNVGGLNLHGPIEYIGFLLIAFAPIYITISGLNISQFDICNWRHYVLAIFYITLFSCFAILSVIRFYKNNSDNPIFLWIDRLSLKRRSRRLSKKTRRLSKKWYCMRILFDYIVYLLTGKLPSYSEQSNLEDSEKEKNETLGQGLQEET